MTADAVYTAAREVNVWLGLAAAIALGYRCVLGWYYHQIVYKPLFVEFVLAVLLGAASSEQSLLLGNRPGPVVVGWTVLFVAVTITCVFTPGPLRRPPQ